MVVAAISGFCYKSGVPPCANRTAPLATLYTGDRAMVDGSMPRRVSVYKITCLETGKAYIGLTENDVPRRWSQHVSEAVRGHTQRGICRSIRKYGAGAFTVETILVAFGREAARLAERELIAAHGTMAPAGYNHSTGGEGIDGHSLVPEARGRISEKVKRLWTDPEYLARVTATRSGASYIEKQRAAHTGQRHTDETRARLSELAKKRWAGVKKKPKYGSVNAGEITWAEIGRLIRTPEVEAKRRATWETNREKNLASIRAANATHNSDPAIIAKRTAGRIAACAKRGPITFSDETRRKMSEAHKARWAARKSKNQASLPGMDAENE